MYASGDPVAIGRCVPIFDGFARAHHDLGPFTSSAATSRMFEVRGPMMVADDYDRPGVSARVFQKGPTGHR